MLWYLFTWHLNDLPQQFSIAAFATTTLLSSFGAAYPLNAGRRRDKTRSRLSLVYVIQRMERTFSNLSLRDAGTQRSAQLASFTAWTDA